MSRRLSYPILDLKNLPTTEAGARLIGLHYSAQECDHLPVEVRYTDVNGLRQSVEVASVWPQTPERP